MDTEIKAPAATVNMELVNKVFDTIAADLAHWDQLNWSTDADRQTGSLCNTTHCFGGWALHLEKRLRVSEGGYVYPVDENGKPTSFAAEAATLLGFNEALAFAVFYNVEEDFEVFKAKVLADIERIGIWTEQQVQAWKDDEVDD